jgi:hypothetical protein
MQSESKIRRHATLVDRMAGAQGLDLEEVMLRGELSIPDLDDTVLRCTSCTQPDACTHWLDSLEGGVAAAPPTYCRNIALFEALKRD